MTQRSNFIRQSTELLKKYSGFSHLVDAGTNAESIHDLVAVRASQISGCGFSLDMHVKQARKRCERELRTYHIPTWRESTLFSSGERAALAWADVPTRLAENGVTDDIYERVVCCSCPAEVSAASMAKRLRGAGAQVAPPYSAGIDAWRTAGFDVNPIVAMDNAGGVEIIRLLTQFPARRYTPKPARFWSSLSCCLTEF